MGFLGDISGSGSDPAVPDGNVAKPLMIALLALLASRYLTGGSKATSTAARADAPSDASPNSTAAASPGDILGGLGGLLKQFQQNGFGDEINSWVNDGANKPVAPNQIPNALGSDVIDALSQRTGLPKDQISQILSQLLPNMVDRLTPQGRLPSRHEIAGGSLPI